MPCSRAPALSRVLSCRPPLDLRRWLPPSPVVGAGSFLDLPVFTFKVLYCLLELLTLYLWARKMLSLADRVPSARLWQPRRSGSVSEPKEALQAPLRELPPESGQAAGVRNPPGAAATSSTRMRRHLGPLPRQSRFRRRARPSVWCPGGCPSGVRSQTALSAVGLQQSQHLKDKAVLEKDLPGSGRRSGRKATCPKAASGSSTPSIGTPESSRNTWSCLNFHDFIWAPCTLYPVTIARAGGYQRLGTL